MTYCLFLKHDNIFRLLALEKVPFSQVIYRLRLKHLVSPRG